MKQHIARALLISLVLFSATGVVMLFADENTINLESKVIQTFDDPAKAPWFALGSKFSTANFPMIAYVKQYPVSLYGSSPENKDIKSLGVAMLFDRQEYNWVDIIPGTKEQPIELPLPGRVKNIDMWVWSGNYDYYIEAFVRDYKGIVYTIPMGDLNFEGWKNLRVNIPDGIPQSKKYLPKHEALSLVKFRIWTRPTEIVAAPTTDPNATNLDRSIKFYINNVKVLTDTYESLYDGDALTRPDVLKDAWGSGQK